MLDQDPQERPRQEGPDPAEGDEKTAGQRREAEGGNCINPIKHVDPSPMEATRNNRPHRHRNQKPIAKTWHWSNEGT
jgi:hypothetical protein